MAMQEERFSLGENSNHMVTVTPFNAYLKVHIKQFYVNENGEIKASRTGVTLSRVDRYVHFSGPIFVYEIH